jgi:phosphoglycolate phosphatase-like HAD superfamily hydrolase
LDGYSLVQAVSSQKAWVSVCAMALSKPLRHLPVATASQYLVLALCDRLGVEPEEAVVVGDTTHDLEMAANAKIRAIAVTTGFRRPLI